jgi:prepilin-type N-terminal cleavage/methylation domain-containing protein
MSCRAGTAMVPNVHWRSTPRQSRGLIRRSSFIVHRSSFSRGFTLVELLVVIAIIVTVSAIVVPLLTPVLDSRRIRESARIVSTQFASAQSEAMAKGRSVGVWIERLGANDPNSNTDHSAAMDLYLCEVPQPYSGDSIDSRITVKVDTTQTPNKYGFSFTSDTGWSGLLRPGDLIRFNYRGPWYTFPSDTAEYQGQPTNTVTKPDVNGIKYLDDSPNKYIDRIRTSPAIPSSSQAWAQAQSSYMDCPMPPVDLPMPYQILRQPVKTSTQPVQLPAGSVIDLFASGTASTMPYFGMFGTQTSTGTTITDRNPLIITFSKSGALDSFYLMGHKFPLVEPIHFLLGQREKLPHVTYLKTDPPETQAEKHNFRDLENLWISINPQTGLITTAEMANVQNESSLTGTEAQMLSSIIPLSRQFATSAQTMGGR